LEAIVKSKETIRRNKDLAHLPLLRNALKLRRRLAGGRNH